MKLSGIFYLSVIILIMILTMDGRNLHISEIRTGYAGSEGAEVLNAAVSSGGFYNEIMTAEIYLYNNEREMMNALLEGNADIVFLQDESILFENDFKNIRIILVCRTETSAGTFVCVRTDTMEEELTLLFRFARAIYGDNTADSQVSLLDPEKWLKEFAEGTDYKNKIMEYLAPDFHKEVVRLVMDEQM